MKKLLTFLVLALVIVAWSPSALAADTANGAQIFSVHCAGCHINGGNIIRRGKNLKQKALKRNGMDTLEAIASLVANGKNNMSAFKNRLNSAEIINVSAYVLEQAEKDWR